MLRKKYGITLLTFFVLIFFMASCGEVNFNTLNIKNVMIQENEIEFVVDLRSIEGAPNVEEKYGGYYFSQPYEDPTTLHLIYMHFRTVEAAEINSIHYFKLNPLAQEYSSQEIFPELDPRNKRSLGFYGGVCWITKDEKIISFDYSSGSLIEHDLIKSTTKKNAPFINSGRIVSLYLKDSTLYFIRDGEDRILYTIDYPTFDPSSLQELYLIDKQSMGISKISYVGDNKLYGTFVNQNKTGVTEINLNDFSEKIVFQRNFREKKDNGEFFWYFFLNPSGAWFGNYWMAQETIKKENVTRKRYHIYDSNAQPKLIVEVNAESKHRLFLKTHSEDTYLYWHDDFILYRWKVPIE